MSGDEDLARVLASLQDSLSLTQKYLQKATDARVRDAVATGEKTTRSDKSSAVERPRPVYHDKIEVFVSYKISWLADISAITSTFKAQFKMFYKWTDPNLIGLPKDSKVDFKKLPGILNPDIELLQSMDCDLLSRYKCISHDTQHNYTTHFEISLISNESLILSQLDAYCQQRDGGGEGNQ